MNDPRDFKVDIAGLSQSEQTASKARKDEKPYLSVYFACCRVYQRVYRNRDATAYEGQCPRCAKPVRFIIGQGGTDARSFVVE